MYSYHQRYPYYYYVPPNYPYQAVNYSQVKPASKALNLSSMSAHLKDMPKLLGQCKQVIQTTQSFAPYVKQYGGLLKSLPDLVRVFATSDNETGAQTEASLDDLVHGQKQQTTTKKNDEHKKPPNGYTSSHPDVTVSSQPNVHTSSDYKPESTSSLSPTKPVKRKDESGKQVSQDVSRPSILKIETFDEM